MRKNVLITGASSGLGKELALIYASEGRNLALCARRFELLETVKAECLTLNPALKIVIKALDVNNHDDVFTCFKAMSAELGGLDRVIVNAGIGRGQAIGLGGFNVNKSVIETNVIAALAQCEAALEIFRTQNSGHLVTISSMSAIRGLPKHMNIYAASKAALAHLTEGLAVEFHNKPITISCIYPGYIKTAINEKYDVKMRVDLKTGVKALHKAIERERARAYIPAFPWAFLRVIMAHAPLGLLKRMV